MGIQVTLERALASERQVIENLTQFYMYDFSEVMEVELHEDGRFENHSLAAYWLDTWRHPFIVRAEGKLAGFALIHTRSRLTANENVLDMAEFFVARRFRHRGVGAQAAFAAFNLFPGRWEVRQRVANIAASAFWRRVIGDYTAGKFEEVSWNNEVWTGPVQSFTSMPK